MSAAERRPPSLRARAPRLARAWASCSAPAWRRRRRGRGRGRVGYDELPGFPRPGVAGHHGRAVLGSLARRAGRRAAGPRAPLRGRRPRVAGHARCARCGAPAPSSLVPTNAAGSLRPEVGPGRLMLISDHINLTGVNPLIGPNDDAHRPALPEPARRLRPGAAGRAARRGRRARHRPRPRASTSRSAARASRRPAEIRAFRTLGADAVGMSTVHEAIAARHCGLRVAAVSVITNLAEGLSDEPLSPRADAGRRGRGGGRPRPRLLERFAEGRPRHEPASPRSPPACCRSSISRASSDDEHGGRHRRARASRR